MMSLERIDAMSTSSERVDPTSTLPERVDPMSMLTENNELRLATQPQLVLSNDATNTFPEKPLLNQANSSASCATNDTSDPTIKRKRRGSNCDVQVVPNKISKIKDEVASCTKEKSLEEPSNTEDDDDIEIVYDSLRENVSKQNSNIRNMLNANYSMKDQKYSMTNCKVNFDELVNSRNFDPSVMSNTNSNINGKQYFVDSFKSTFRVPKLTEEDLSSNELTNYHNQQSKNRIKDGSMGVCSGKYDKTISNANSKITMEQYPIESNQSDTMFWLSSNFERIDNMVIKIEQELQINDTNVDAVCNSKQVQQQPKTKFSEVVDLSDTEDDILPHYQLFGGFDMKTSLKQEVKEEKAEAEHEKFSMVDDEDSVTLSYVSHKDEYKNWVRKWMRSQTVKEEKIQIQVKDDDVTKEEHLDNALDKSVDKISREKKPIEPMGKKVNLSVLSDINNNIKNKQNSVGSCKNTFENLRKSTENRIKDGSAIIGSVKYSETTNNALTKIAMEQYSIESNQSNTLLSSPNYDFTGDMVIKIEEEFQIIDTNVDAVSNSIVPPTKQVQKQPKTKSSEVDAKRRLYDGDKTRLSKLPCSQTMKGGEIKIYAKDDDVTKEQQAAHALDKSADKSPSNMSGRLEAENQMEKRNERSTRHEGEDENYDYRNANEVHSLNTTSMGRMKVDSVDTATNSIESSSDSTISCKKFFKNRTPSSFGFRSQENDSRLTSNTTELVTTPTKKVSIRKSILIEPPLHLPTTKRNNSAKQSPENSPKESSKKKKESIEKDKVEEQRKSTDCLSPTQTKTSPFSKEEKKQLVDERKQKLKKIALDKTQDKNKNNQERKRTKPNVKTSLKTRSDMLIEDTISAFKLKYVKEKPQSVTWPAAANNVVASPRTLDSVKGGEVAIKMPIQLQNSSSLGEPDVISNKSNAAKAKTQVFGQDALEAVVQSQKIKDVKSTFKGAVVAKHKSIGAVVAASSSLKFSIQKPRKHVTFDPAITGEDASSRTVAPLPSRAIAPLPSRTVVPVPNRTVAPVPNITVAPVPSRTVAPVPNITVAPVPSKTVAPVPSKTVAPVSARTVMMNDFLLLILLWKPAWLEEQQRFNSTAPVVRDDDISGMLSHYKSYDEYYRAIFSRLLLMTWHGITKESQAINNKYSQPPLVCSIIHDSIEKNTSSSNLHFTILKLDVLVKRENLEKLAYPSYGDLVCFEYSSLQPNCETFQTVFGYVMEVRRTILWDCTYSDKESSNYVEKQTYTVLTRPLVPGTLVNRVRKLRSVINLQFNLWMVQALEYLPKSPLMNLILTPTIEQYHLPAVPINSEQLFTRDKLNKKQLETVFKVTETIVQKQAKLCFIQGPPGTGKSKVIVNIVSQLWYEKNRSTSSEGALKILVCAPTDAAIDEITLRLYQIRSCIKQNRFKMVRIGQPDMIHPNVKVISMAELANNYVEREKSNLESTINALKCETASTDNMPRKKYLQMKMADLQKQMADLNVKSSENEVLRHADVITCTLSSCCSKQMETFLAANKEGISVCIMDEATQSTEAETLIPLMLGVNTLVLAGDSNQLPPTVPSPLGKITGQDQSIFSRVQCAFEMNPTNPIIMLDTQYRMSHDICWWPNKFFYGGKLETGIIRNGEFPFHSYRIFNLHTNENNDNSNTAEGQFVVNMIYTMLMYANWDGWECISYGILTPYKNQKHLIQMKINEKLSAMPENLKKKIIVDVGTIDEFRGQERDVVIMSCVRSENIGILSDWQRVCVALTRAKRSLLVCGNFTVFNKDPMWNSLLTDAKSREVYFNLNAQAEHQQIEYHVVKRS